MTSPSAPVRIGIIGRAGAGKTTLAHALLDRIKEINGEDTQIVAFADKLKDICRDVFGMVDKDRALLQKVGDALRSVKKSVFIDYLMRTVDSNPDKHIIIHDIRFPNEARACLSRGFDLVFLDVDEATQIARGRRTGHEHKSESGVDGLTAFASLHATSSNSHELDALVEQILRRHMESLRRRKLENMAPASSCVVS